MQWLPTVLSTVVAVIAVIAARFCVAEALRLTRITAGITAFETRIDGIDSRLRKLAGSYYVGLRRDRAVHEEWDPVPDSDSHGQVGVRGGAPNGSVCENWALAQLDGPQSKAARCDCEYCDSMRRARAAVKAALVPRGATAVAKFTEDNQ